MVRPLLVTVVFFLLASSSQRQKALSQRWCLDLLAGSCNGELMVDFVATVTGSLPASDWWSKAHAGGLKLWCCSWGLGTGCI